jgi:hypothetical protein
MKTYRTLFLLTSLLALFALPITALAAPAPGSLLSVRPDQFVFGDNYILEANSTLNGNLWVFGGNAELRTGSRVNGSILIFGGNLRVDGTVEGDITAAGGNIQLRDNAVVRGSVNMMGGSVSRASGARIEGDVTDQSDRSFVFPRVGPVTTPNINVNNPVVEFMGFLFQSLITAALAVLVALFIPVQSERVARTAVSQPLVSGGLGLATVIVLPILMLILVVTIILIPVSLILGLLLALAILYGWIAVGIELGKRMARLFKSDWTLPLAAGIGTLTLSLVIGGAGRYIWCVGWLLPAAVSLVGLGAVLLTRFGTQSYPAFRPPYGTPPAPVPSPSPRYPGAAPQNPYDPAAPSYPGVDYPAARDFGSPPAGSGDPSGGGTTSSGANVYPPDDDEPTRRG